MGFRGEVNFPYVSLHSSALDRKLLFKFVMDFWVFQLTKAAFGLIPSLPHMEPASIRLALSLR